MLQRKLIAAVAAGVVFVFSINGFSRQESRVSKVSTRNAASKSVKKNGFVHTRCAAV